MYCVGLIVKDLWTISYSHWIHACGKVQRVRRRRWPPHCSEIFILVDFHPCSIKEWVHRINAQKKLVNYKHFSRLYNCNLCFCRQKNYYKSFIWSSLSNKYRVVWRFRGPSTKPPRFWSAPQRFSQRSSKNTHYSSHFSGSASVRGIFFLWSTLKRLVLQYSEIFPFISIVG